MRPMRIDRLAYRQKLRLVLDATVAGGVASLILWLATLAL